MAPSTVRWWRDAAIAARRHWPEYLMEAGELGLFMLAACSFGALLYLPHSPVVASIPSSVARGILMGVAMGTTAILIIHSPWGKRSGAHFNPAVTLTFFRLDKVKPWDACFYMVGQFAGGLAGVLAAVLLLGRSRLGDPAVNYVATVPGVPGTRGTWVAFLAEFVMAFALMSMVLFTTNHCKLSRYTSYFAGLLVASYISVAAPVSGMSMNPARTTASAIPGHIYRAIWVYFTAAPLAMLTAAELYQRVKGCNKVFCAKLHHRNGKRCIFNCRFEELESEQVSARTNNSL